MWNLAGDFSNCKIRVFKLGLVAQYFREREREEEEGEEEEERGSPRPPVVGSELRRSDQLVGWIRMPNLVFNAMGRIDVNWPNWAIC